MIGLKANSDIYDYDIRTLLQAFFDNEKIVPSFDDTRMQMEVCFEKGGEHSITFVSPEQTTFTRTFSGDYEDKMALRNVVKDAVYDILCEYTGRTLPWGTLTGIRPVKIVTGLLESGLPSDVARQQFINTYRTTEQKADLSVSVALKEQEILRDIDYQDGYSLYIGIPFCPSTCLYCSFTSYPIGVYESMVEEYLKALYREMQFASEAMKDRVPVSIYIGGGTPTSLNARQLSDLLRHIEKLFPPEHLREFTVEAGRADSISPEKLQVLKAGPVTRISINPQTMQDETLKLIGRRHTVTQFEEAYAMAREIGFDNINMDLIMGLPGETIADVRDTLDKVRALSPDNLTIHSLAVKRAAHLNTERERYQGLSKGCTDEMLIVADETARALGMEPYYLYRQKNIPGNFENVGYAKPGTEGIYNILIMEEKHTILALGAGAASKYVFPNGGRIERTENVKDVKLYISRVDEMIARKREMLTKLL